MAQIDRWYVGIGLLWLIAGLFLGFYMGAANDARWLDTHVAMVLTGFATLTIYGAVFRLWPAMSKPGLARIQFWSSVVGALGIISGATEMALGGGVTLAAAGGALFILGALLMGWLFWSESA